MSTHAPRARAIAPRWESTRPFMTGAALLEGATTRAPPLASQASSAQHALVAEDALHALLGMRATYAIVRQDATGVVQYVVDDVALRGAEPAIRPLLSRVLVLAAHHAVVRRFVEGARVAGRESGYVRQAIGVALSELLSDYRMFIVRLETALRTTGLSLQKLLYYVQPSVRSMALLRKIVQSCQGLHGAAALDALHKLAMSHVGSDDAKQVLAFVIGKAAAPVFSTMDTWIRHGIVDDPFSEFFIQENKRLATTTSFADASSAKVWEMRYTINKDNLPDFLVPFLEKVLRSGKYLNVLRECGVDTTKAIADANAQIRSSPSAPDTFDDSTNDDERFSHMRLSGSVLLGPDASRRIAHVVEKSFTAASLALKTYLDGNVRIIDRLRSLRKYFLLEQSDFLVHFFDSAANELAKDRADVSKSRLASLLELSIRTSVSASDPFHDDLSCTLFPDDLASHILVMVGTEEEASNPRQQKSPFMTGYESFSLDYKLKWPMNLIIPEMEIIKYQLLFRYLFYCKHVERELEECWRNHSQAKGPLRKARHHFVRSFALRNRMLQFVRNILYYTVADVIEPNWRRLESSVKKANTIDEIMQHHYNFLHTSVIQSLLSNEKHLKVFKSISQTCLSFAGYTETFSELFVGGSSVEAIEERLRARNYPAAVAKFETTFDMHLGRLLDGLSAVSKKRANIHLANLCERLDMGGFYGRAAERSLASFGSYGL